MVREPADLQNQTGLDLLLQELQHALPWNVATYRIDADINDDALDKCALRMAKV